MSTFGHVVRWLCGRPVRPGNCYDPGDTDWYGVSYICASGMSS